jgi:hypothetical protein
VVDHVEIDVMRIAGDQILPTAFLEWGHAEPYQVSTERRPRCSVDATHHAHA